MNRLKSERQRERKRKRKRVDIFSGAKCMISHVTCLAFANIRMTDYNTNIENQGFDGVCVGLQFMEIRSNFVSTTCTNIPNERRFDITCKNTSVCNSLLITIFQL